MRQTRNLTPGGRGRVNTKRRLKWPQYKTAGQLIHPDYKAFTRDISVCYGLVNIAAEVLKRPLRLVAGGPADGIVKACTDGKTIWLPKTHPNRITVTKHELAHIYFGSDGPLRVVWTNEVLNDIENHYDIEIPAHVRKNVIEGMLVFLNIIDDVRVNSCWGLMYPGDGVDMRAWYQDTVGPDMMAKAEAHFPDGDVSDFFTFAILVALEQEPRSTLWGWCYDELAYVRDNVQFKDYSAVFLYSRSLMYQLIERMLKAPPPEPDEEQGDGPGPVSPGQPGSAGDAIGKMGTGARPDYEHFADHNAGLDHGSDIDPTLADRKKLKKLMKLMQVDPLDEKEVEDKAFDSEENARHRADYIQRRTATVRQTMPPPDLDDELRKKVKTRVDLTWVDQEDLRPVPLTLADRKTIQRWRTQFQRVVGAKKRVLLREGQRLDVGAYVLQKTGKEPFECFVNELPGRGFRLGVLVDMSSSMTYDFPEVERLAAVMAKALDFPFVDVTFMGFSAPFEDNREGAVDIYVYPRNPEGLTAPNARVGGLTPLHTAVQVCGNDLLNSPDEKHLFLLSDGMPVWAPKGKLNTHYKSTKTAFRWTQTLMEWTADQVKELRSKKVKVHCFMVGPDVPTDAQMDWMFGPGNWRKIPRGPTIFEESWAFIQKSFLSYIRRL